MGVKAALIVVTAGVGAYYVYTMMTSSEPASGTMHVPRLIASSASNAQPVAIEAIEAIGTKDPPAPEPQPVRTGKLIKSAARSATPSDYQTSKPITSWVKPGSVSKSDYLPMATAVNRAPAPRPMKPMQHWLEAHQLA